MRFIGGSVVTSLRIRQVYCRIFLVDSLQSSLDSPLLNDFIAALEQLTNPEMVFKVCVTASYSNV